ncbi:MAG: hypothetical protein IT448_11630 [Phycisphaerales bacterium]|nr:hypothetical protein [Phycisphaerales bacterium]
MIKVPGDLPDAQEQLASRHGLSAMTRPPFALLLAGCNTDVAAASECLHLKQNNPAQKV